MSRAANALQVLAAQVLATAEEAGLTWPEVTQLGLNVIAGGLEACPAPMAMRAEVIRRITAGLQRLGKPRSCRVCGCSEGKGCLPDAHNQSCHWIEADLCSRCEGRAAPPAPARRPA